jgi:ferredoxin
MITITFITNDNKTVQAPDNSNLLRVSLREKGGIPFKCGGGICGTCRCRIEVGLEHADKVKAKERKHLTDADLAAGYRMACQTFVNGDVSVSWTPMEDRKRPVPSSAPASAVAAADPSSSAGEPSSASVDRSPVEADAS